MKRHGDRRPASQAWSSNLTPLPPDARCARSKSVTVVVCPTGRAIEQTESFRSSPRVFTPTRSAAPRQATGRFSWVARERATNRQFQLHQINTDNTWRAGGSLAQAHRRGIRRLQRGARPQSAGPAHQSGTSAPWNVQVAPARQFQQPSATEYLKPGGGATRPTTRTPSIRGPRE